MIERNVNFTKIDHSIQNDVLTVSEITREIKLTIENEFHPLWIKGEISNFTDHSSGHAYFSLKDANCQISCVLWKNINRRLLFQLKDGIQVIVRAVLSVYERQGRYQLNIQSIRPAGIGELQIEFERLKKILQNEGLFNEEFKKPIPSYPERIGIVTSSTGAALQDIRSIIQRRFPSVKIILWPVSVQGLKAASEIAGGIEAFNEYGQVDLLIVGRGGGSLEDLWAFNEEIVARAIFNSKIPVISAVGHEIDFTLSDFTADRRAPTPSAAAEIAVPDKIILDRQLSFLYRRMIKIINDTIIFYKEKINFIQNSYVFRLPFDRIREFRLQIFDFSHNLKTTMKYYLSLYLSELDNFQGKLNALNPDAILQRGYSITTRLSDQKVVNNAGFLNKQERIRIKFAQGSVESTVDNIRKE